MKAKCKLSAFLSETAQKQKKHSRKANARKMEWVERSKTYKPQAENKVTGKARQGRAWLESRESGPKQGQGILKRISKLTAIRKESQFEWLNRKSCSKVNPFAVMPLCRLSIPAHCQKCRLMLLLVLFKDLSGFLLTVCCRFTFINSFCPKRKKSLCPNTILPTTDTMDAK